MTEAKRILKDGTALTKFRQIVRAQGGDDGITSNTIKIHANSHHVKALYKGVVTRVNNYNLSSIAKLLGAPHDRYAGIYMHKKIGDEVEKNENCLTLYSSKTYNVREANETLKMFPIYIIE